MKRELPFLSPVSVLIAVLVFSGLGFTVWKNGGLGFSPGPVSAHASPGVQLQQVRSHVDFEQDCKLCHQPLSSDQASLCIQCHENIAEQRAAQTGTHGRIDPSLTCASCHPEHKGRDFDPVAYAVSQFDHHQTGLSLSGAHAALQCEACHKAGAYKLTYAGCSGCHAEPAAHAGMYPLSCDECHTDLSWQPAMMDNLPFDHSQVRFSFTVHASLTGAQAVACYDCHTAQGGKANLKSCAACHARINKIFMADHLATMGPDCLQCHDGTDRMAAFNHEAVFPLDGYHSQLACSDCHANFHFQGTSADCSTCHQEPDIHAGFFGTQCHYCHNTENWTPAKLVEHTFVLDHGGQGELACQICHPDSYPAYTCTTCHEHSSPEVAARHQELGMLDQDLSQCARCHPTGQAGEAERLQPGGGVQ